PRMKSPTQEPPVGALFEKRGTGVDAKNVTLPVEGSSRSITPLLVRLIRINPSGRTEAASVLPPMKKLASTLPLRSTWMMWRLLGWGTQKVLSGATPKPNG